MNRQDMPVPFPGPLATKKRADLTRCSLREEASTGFEPVVRVLQTLALPLGHDAS